MSANQSVSLSVSQLVSSVSQSVSLSISQLVSQFIFSHICPSPCQSASPSDCLSIHQFRATISSNKWLCSEELYVYMIVIAPTKTIAKHSLGF